MPGTQKRQTKSHLFFPGVSSRSERGWRWLSGFADKQGRDQNVGASQAGSLSAPDGRDGGLCPPEASGPRPRGLGTCRCLVRPWCTLGDGSGWGMGLLVTVMVLPVSPWKLPVSVPLPPALPGQVRVGRLHSRPLAAPWLYGEEP